MAAREALLREWRRGRGDSSSGAVDGHYDGGSSSGSESEGAAAAALPRRGWGTRHPATLRFADPAHEAEWETWRARGALATDRLVYCIASLYRLLECFLSPASASPASCRCGWPPTA